MANNIDPKISIIVPVFNGKEYISKCLDTLHGQTLFDIEIIIVDDNSSEDIKTAIRDYLKDSRICYIRLENNCGPGGARNVGLKKATGKYIGFCDCDDWVDFNYYEQCFYYMEQNSADIGMLSLVRESDTSEKERIFKCHYEQFMKLDSDKTIKILTYQLSAGIKVIPPCTNKIYRKTFLNSISALFEERMYFQDVLFAFHTITQTNNIICIPKAEYHHYRRNDSIIQSFSKKHIDDFTKLFSLIRRYLRKNDLYERYCLNYYSLCSHFYNIIVKQIFQFVPEEKSKKEFLRLSFAALKKVVDFEEYFEFVSAEEIRRHIQPHISDTFLY